MGKRIVIALGGNALGKNLPEQMVAVKHTAKAIVDLIEEGHQVVVAHGNGPQVGMINIAMTTLSREDPTHPMAPMSVCTAMSMMSKVEDPVAALMAVDQGGRRKIF